MAARIPRDAELIFIKAVHTGTVHTAVRHMPWHVESDEPRETVSGGAALVAMATKPTLTRCGKRTHPQFERNHVKTDRFSDDRLCRACYRTLHRDDQERAFEHAQPHDDADEPTEGEPVTTDDSLIETATIDGRDYQIFRVGKDPNTSGWNVFAIRPLHTPAERAMPEPRQPYLPYAYASPVAPSKGWVGHPDAPIAEGWQVMDEMNREVFGHATTVTEAARIAADSLPLPTA